MKNFYTIQDLEALSQDELLSLTSFIGGGIIYYYSEISNISVEDGQYCINFKDKSELYAESYDKILPIIKNKARYELTVNIINNNKIDIDNRNELYNNLKQESTKIYETTAISMINIVDDTKEVFDKHIRGIDKEFKNSLSELSNKVNEINNIDLELFNKKMEKLDSILDSFKEILKD